MSKVKSFSAMVPHIAPESCPPWPGSRTTKVNGAGAATRRIEVAVRGIERTCHQRNDPSMSESPSQVTMFCIVPPKPKRRRDIVTFEDWNAVLRLTKSDTESHSCCRVRAQPLQYWNWQAARRDISGSHPSPAIPSCRLSPFDRGSTLPARHLPRRAALHP